MSINEFLAGAIKHKKRDTSPLEIDIEGTFVTYAKKLGYTAFKLIILNRRGFPDRTVIGKNKTLFFIEFKRKNKPLSAQQVIIKRILVNYGFDYYVCDEIGQAEAILDRYV